MAISSVFLFTIAERTLRSGVASELRVCQLLSDALGCFLSNLTGIIDTDQSLSLSLPALTLCMLLGLHFSNPLSQSSHRLPGLDSWSRTSILSPAPHVFALSGVNALIFTRWVVQRPKSLFSEPRWFKVIPSPICLLLFLLTAWGSRSWKKMRVQFVTRHLTRL